MTTENANTNDQNTNTEEAKGKLKGFWNKHGRKVVLATGTVALVGGGVAIGLALKTRSVSKAVEDVVDATVENTTE